MKRTKVHLEETGNTLRLYWYHRGKRYSLSNGDRNTPIGKGMALQTAGQISADCDSGNFDPTLMKYRRRISGPKPAEIKPAKLITAFGEFKLREGDISQRSFETRYKPLAIALTKRLDSPCHRLTTRQARDFAKHCETTLTAGTAKGRLWLMVSAWKWAKGRFDVGTSNPWEGLADSIKKKPQRKNTKPFNRDEIAAIKAAFAGSKYEGVVILLFATACRPGEIFGLRWCDISEDFSSIWIRNAVSRGVETGTTKTGVDRQVPLNSQASQALRDRYTQQSPESLVFAGVDEAPIKDTAFRSAWRRTLAKAGVKYRCPRNVRPSVISLNRLRAEVDPVAFANTCGHSLRTQDDIYRRAVENVEFMEL